MNTVVVTTAASMKYRNSVEILAFALLYMITIHIVQYYVYRAISLLVR